MNTSKGGLEMTSQGLCQSVQAAAGSIKHLIKLEFIFLSKRSFRDRSCIQKAAYAQKLNNYLERLRTAQHSLTRPTHPAFGKKSREFRDIFPIAGMYAEGHDAGDRNQNPLLELVKSTGAIKAANCRTMGAVPTRG